MYSIQLTLFFARITYTHTEKIFLNHFNKIVFQKYEKLVMADGWVREGGYSMVDVESVDMTKFPQLQNIPYNRITISKGDCIFIPFK